MGHLNFGLYKAKKLLTKTDEEQYLFEMAPAVQVKLQVRDHDGKPTIAVVSAWVSFGCFSIQSALV